MARGPFFSFVPHAELDGRLAALDGLRAIAVLLVFAHHSQAPFFSGGFIGVDLFFVLSGFLITQLLLKSRARFDSLRFATFYSHRFMRLFPALALLCLALALYGWAIGAPARAWSDIWPALTYVTDIARDHPGAPDWLGHTWSLAVEEQFYVVWPLAMAMLMAARLRASSVAAVLICAICAIAVWRGVVFAQGGAMRAYDGFDTHADGLLIGCLLAICSHRAIGLLARLWPLGAALLAAITVIGHWTDPMLYQGGFTLIALSAAAVVSSLVVQPRWSPTALLNLAPLRLIGRISYGAYLWHYPLFLIVGAQLHLGPMTSAALAAPLTLLIAAASFFWIERPLLAARDAMPVAARAITGAAGPLCLAMGVATVALYS